MTIISAPVYLLYLLSLHKSLIYPPFRHVLYDECSENMGGKCSSAKCTMRNYSEETLKKHSGLRWYLFQEIFRHNP